MAAGTLGWLPVRVTACSYSSVTLGSSQSQMAVLGGREAEGLMIEQKEARAKPYVLERASGAAVARSTLRECHR